MCIKSCSHHLLKYTHSQTHNRYTHVHTDAHTSPDTQSPTHTHATTHMHTHNHSHTCSHAHTHTHTHILVPLAEDVDLTKLECEREADDLLVRPELEVDLDLGIVQI